MNLLDVDVERRLSSEGNAVVDGVAWMDRPESLTTSKTRWCHPLASEYYVFSPVGFKGKRFHYWKYMCILSRGLKQMEGAHFTENHWYPCRHLCFVVLLGSRRKTSAETRQTQSPKHIKRHVIQNRQPFSFFVFPCDPLLTIGNYVSEPYSRIRATCDPCFSCKVVPRYF